MMELQETDIQKFIFDLELYSGNIREITILRGPQKHDFHSFCGVVHTSMDSFSFTVWGMATTGEDWGMTLSDPVQSLRKGHRHEVPIKIPKLHKDPELVKRYRQANLLYQMYNNRSGVDEISRRLDLEESLGYHCLPDHQSVLDAIVADYRPYGENLKKRRLEVVRHN